MGQLSESRESFVGVGIEMSTGSAFSMLRIMRKRSEPYHRKGEWAINMHEKAGDLILVVEYETVSPSNDRTRKATMA